jgi:hypothetical protein
VEIDEFMCRIDGRVVKEVPKREVRDAYGFWGGSLGVNFDRPAVRVALGVGVTAAAASLAAAFSAVLKVFQWSPSMSQVGWEVGMKDDIILAHFTALLSFNRCALWYSCLSSRAWTFSTGRDCQG